MTPPNLGGARPGAGRPRKYDDTAEMQTFSVYLPRPLLERLDRLCEQRGVSRNEYLAKLIARSVARSEI